MLPESKQNKDVDYDFYVVLIGALNSAFAIILLLLVFTSQNPQIGHFHFQAWVALGLFGWLCGVTGTIMVNMSSLKSKMKNIDAINVALLMIASICYLITALVWICKYVHPFSFCAFVISILYFGETALKMKANAADITDLDESIDI
eukprot:157079_1